MTKFYTAKYDAMFKAIFCKKENEDLLKFLLEKCLDRKIKIKEIHYPELLKKNVYEKGKTLDVLVEVEGEIINIEVNSGYYSNLHRRNASYIFKKYAEGIKKGEDYSQMGNYIQINFTCNLPKKNPEIGIYSLIDKESKTKYIDNLIIYEYNVDKIKEMCYNKGEEKYSFIAMLNSDKKELDKICGGNKYMEKFKEEVENLNSNKEMVEFLSAEEEAELLRNTLMNEAKAEGLKQGMEEGREIGIEQGIEQGIHQGIHQGILEGQKEEKIKIAKNMLSMNLELEIISNSTGLTKEEIEILK